MHRGKRNAKESLGRFFFTGFPIWSGMPGTWIITND